MRRVAAALLVLTSVFAVATPAFADGPSSPESPPASPSPSANGFCILNTSFCLGTLL